MGKATTAAVCLLHFASFAWSQDALAPETLARIKRATVYVKVKVQGKEASGSGFVVKVDGDSALIVTNHHVVEPNVQLDVTSGPAPGPGLPGLPLPKGWTPRWAESMLKNADVAVVLESGTKSERTFKAELLTIDPLWDLAVLRIKNAANPPAPIDYSKSPMLAETMPVFTFGFPFGKVLATSKASPAITVGKAAISSLRQDDDGALALVQIDGALNPGNSGGPVVDAKGQLIGVAVATIRGGTGIGLTIPGVEVGKILQGRPGAYLLNAAPPENGKTKIVVELATIDPLRKVASVRLLCLPARDDPDKKLKSLVKAPGVQTVPLKLEEQTASGDLTLDGDVRNAELLLQAVFANEQGKEQKSALVRYRLGGSKVLAKGKFQPPVRPIPKAKSAGNTTNVVGGGLRDGYFQEEAPDDGVLIGFEFAFGSFATKETISAVRPIYRTKTGEVKGKLYGSDVPTTMTIKAKDGYAVSGVDIRASLPIFGLSVKFMRLQGDKLNPDDNYESKWIGTPGSAFLKALDSGEMPVVGIAGRISAQGGYCSGLGLVLKRAAK